MSSERRNYILKGYIINIKLKKREYVTEELIGTVFSRLQKKKVRKKISRDREVAVRRLFTTTIDQERIYYGEFCSVINLDGVDWLNLKSMDKTTYEIPPNLRASLIDSDFVLIPSIHRVFLIHKSNGITRTQITKFLEKAIYDVVPENVYVEVYEEKSHSYIEEIKKLSAISKVQVNISKSNNDNSKKSAKIVEDLLEETKALKSQLIFQSSSQGSLNVDSKIIEGSLELAKSNGNAIIKGENINGQTEIINTKDHVDKVEIEIESEETKKRDIIRELKRRFKRTKNGRNR